MVESVRHNITEVIGFGAYVVLVVFIIPLTIALGVSGTLVTDSFVLDKFILGIVGAIFMLIIMIIAQFKDSGAKSIWYINSYIHEPFKGIKNLSKRKFIKNPVLLYIISLLSFSTLFLIAGLGNFFFGRTRYTAVEISGHILNIEPWGFFEVARDTLLLGVFYGLALKLSDNRRNEFVYWSVLIFGALLIAVFEVINHYFRYSNSFPDLFNVFLFFIITLLFVAFTGSFLVGWAFHTSSLLFNSLFVSMSNMNVIAYSSLSLILGWFLLIVFVKVIRFFKREEGGIFA